MVGLRQARSETGKGRNRPEVFPKDHWVVDGFRPVTGVPDVGCEVRSVHRDGSKSTEWFQRSPETQ